MRILLTGIAGFIGYHLAIALSKQGYNIIGIDNINEYYDLNIKFSRLKNLGIDINLITEDKPIVSSLYNITFIKTDISNFDNLEKIFINYKIDKIVHLAAQAGVRYSLKNPKIYIKSNILGFFNILENARNFTISDIILASSSSVYGNSQVLPLSEVACINDPVSLYAATKISDEMLAKSYSHLFDMNITVLRFFTVYGEWGRPDMAYYIFTEKILNDLPIKLYFNGNLFRDFTYINDIIQGILLIIEGEKLLNKKFRIYNIGSGKNTRVLDLVRIIENSLQKKARIVLSPFQKGDVYNTLADISKIKKDLGYQPKVNLETGIKKFVDWYISFKNINL